MSMRVLRSVFVLSLLLFALPMLSGCGQTTTLPDTVQVKLPDGTTTTVQAGAGVATLASTRWTFFRSADNLQSGAFATVRFGENGNLEAFENNKLAESIFGDEIIFDNSRRATKQIGLSYEAATYGAQTSDASGFSFEGRLTAFAAGITAGTGTASAEGAFNPDDPDRIQGTFTFTTEVTLLDIPEANVTDVFSFIGVRVQE
jgi:hypothetical protein